MVKTIKSFITKVRVKWLAKHIRRKVLKKIKKDFHLKSYKEAEKQLQRILICLYAIEGNIDNDNADGI